VNFHVHKDTTSHSVMFRIGQGGLSAVGYVDS